MVASCLSPRDRQPTSSQEATEKEVSPEKESPSSSHLQCHHSTDRGATYAFELVVALIIISVGVFSTVAATGITPSDIQERPTPTPEATVDVELQTALTTSIIDGSAKQTALAWDSSEGEFTDQTGTPTAGTGQFLTYPETAFGQRLQAIANRYDVQMNVYLVPEYPPTDPGTDAREQSTALREPLIQRGTPDETARVVEETIVLYDTDRLQSPATAHRTTAGVTDATAGTQTVSASSSYPVEEGHTTTGSPVYNTVTLRVVIWNV